MQHAVQAAILIKAAALGPGQVSDGAVTTLLNSDAGAVLQFGERLQLIWALPLEILAICGVIIAIAGFPGVAAVIAAFIMFSAQTGLSNFNGPMSVSIRKWQGLLLATTTDIVRNMKSVKMAAWEAALLPHITRLRGQNLDALKKLGQLSISVSILSLALPTVCIFAAVLTAYIGGWQLNASFMATVALFAQLRTAFLSLGPGLRLRAGALVSVKHIEDFLCLPVPATVGSWVVRTAAEPAANIEATPESPRRLEFLPPVKEESEVVARDATIVDFDEAPVDRFASVIPDEVPEKGPTFISNEAAISAWRTNAGAACDMPSPDVLVSVSGATCEWFSGKVSTSTTTSPAAFSLRELSFSVRRGVVLGVTGASGAGKTAVMNILLGDLKPNAGAAMVRGRVAFTSQAVWLEPGSVRDNILFGLPMREEWYAKVLSVSERLFLSRLDQGWLPFPLLAGLLSRPRPWAHGRWGPYTCWRARWQA